jgi:chromosome segregation ATPase
VDQLIARRSLPPGFEEKLQTLQHRVQSEFEEVASQIAQLDPTLVDATKTAGSKIRHQFEQLEGRVARAFARHHDDLQRHAAHLSGSLYPNRELQERVLSAAEWNLRTGGSLIGQLHQAISVDCPDHQLISV